MCEVHVTEGDRSELWFLAVKSCKGNPARRDIVTAPWSGEQEAIGEGTRLIKQNNCDVSRVVVYRQPPKRGVFG